MKLDLAIPGFTIKAVDGGQCTGKYVSSDPGHPQIANCPTNAIFAIYRGESSEADYRCWKHLREFLAQNATTVADIVIQLLLQQRPDEK